MSKILFPQCKLFPFYTRIKLLTSDYKCLKQGGAKGDTFG